MSFSDIIYYMKIGITYIAPLVALLVSIISLYKSSKGQDLQDRVNKLELRIKQYEVAELDKRLTEAELACVEARVIHVSKGKYKLKVWNSGQATAYKVSISIDKEVNLQIWNPKTPFEFLGAGKSFDEHLLVSLETANKFKIVTKWENVNGDPYQKEQIGSL